ncbi:unnamed protein product [Clonostachys chloroleuca]|uniref:Uncharacterized protein n=1 Tax=Clonostachys chloroleuca TaxID=1926264 RepID=A0AA35MGS9_9HYPO|nr:unnamed protein product [Clonostachys chloroleuca]
MPPVRLLREVPQNGEKGEVVSRNNHDPVVLVKRDHLLNISLRLFRVVGMASLDFGEGDIIAALRVYMFSEELARANIQAEVELGFRPEGRGRQLLGDRSILAGPPLRCMMTDIRPHEDESFGRVSIVSLDIFTMLLGLTYTWRLEQIEALVFKIVDGWKASDC